MPSVDRSPLSGRYLSFTEREEIAILRAQGVGVRGTARRLGRSPSTISRELAQRRDQWRQARVPGVGGAVEGRAGRSSAQDGQAGRHPRLREYVQQRLAGELHRADATSVSGPGRRSMAATSRVARIGAGRPPGARSRSPNGSSLSSPMICRCGSRRSDLPGALRAKPRRAQTRAGRLSADRPRVAGPACSHAKSAWRACQCRGDDQPAARRGG